MTRGATISPGRCLLCTAIRPMACGPSASSPTRGNAWSKTRATPTQRACSWSLRVNSICCAPCARRPRRRDSTCALRRHGSALFAEPSEVNREECSLWYVALTRARREVLVTAAAADRDDIELALSPFAYGVRESGPKGPLLHEESAGAKAPAPQITEPEVQPRRPVRRAIERLSPSMVSTFLICPRRFFYHYVLRLKPEMDKEVTLLGKLLHR